MLSGIRAATEFFSCPAGRQSNGVVISSIYGREETRTYAKPLENGKSKYELSSEEKEAITKAREMLLFAAQGRRG